MDMALTYDNAKAAGIPDPDDMNDRRAETAATAVHSFQIATGSDEGDAISDLLCNLMHLCARRDVTFDDELRRARAHYSDETLASGEEPAQ